MHDELVNYANICTVICNSGKLGPAGELGVATLLKFIARSISRFVYFGLLEAWDIFNKYFGCEGQLICQTTGCFRVSLFHIMMLLQALASRLQGGPDELTCFPGCVGAPT